ncbi:AAA family ATPase [Candidatus Micrarchaeota archaeon]|nr:AAA family ATPase [Candidatus Micrarchaeota archaeon]
MKNYFSADTDTDSYGQIIVNEEMLLPQYLPEEVIGREKEMEMIASSVKPLVKKRAAENLFVFGSSGIGKTTCVKNILRQLKGHTNAVIPVYVNCWENNTQLAVYNRILDEMRLPIPRRGLATDEVFDQILNFAKKEDKRILLILDDLDGLKGAELLYVIGKANEKGVVFGVIGISNSKDMLANMDNRIRSALHFGEMEYHRYDEEQLTRILKMRSEKALRSGSCDERVLTKIARSIEDGSARVAIERLWRAARSAEKAQRSKIMIQDVEDIILEKSEFKLGELNLAEEEKYILELLQKSNGEARSPEIYEKFEEKYKLTKRQIRNYIESLEKKGLIESADLPSEGMLKTKLLKLKTRK